ncbi:hypothetical protein bsdE14_17630 [Clostridium omnivorum]|uniref:Uncharacterized protein n=1 Tax=Clostridium omnivorum TaxID=1604902 RepID=A0ABQ5N552_9CLOT|nr:hypothetical protein bsdE14_17630 [Clostridium sp. E14]
MLGLDAASEFSLFAGGDISTGLFFLVLVSSAACLSTRKPDILKLAKKTTSKKHKNMNSEVLFFII